MKNPFQVFCAVLLLILCASCSQEDSRSSSGNAVEQDSTSGSDLRQYTDKIVRESVAEILNIRSEQIVPEKKFWEQPNNGDALDLVESIMSIEEKLGIMIDDQKLDEMVGAKGVDDIAQKIRVKDLQDVVFELYSAKQSKIEPGGSGQQR